ncbi:MAG: NUDIX hydrolase [Muribaculaceae bacterium]|nr:NUDIX hydrolase [Roseburia sp.]MCM1431574.1 NUDIX hydrolase [Muribaculaceae bacterium]MCM1492039.1 NUDIX hydrolase [Muribaculaceae bacterium]
MIFKAENGAAIIERINVSENEAIEKFANLNHALVIVKIEGDYLLGWHKWRSDWETFGGRMEAGESLRECIVRECEEELGIRNVNFEYLGIVHYDMPPDYWVKDWHEEYGGLYGITLDREAVQTIEEKRQDKEEIGEIRFYSELKARKENIDEINEKLLEFY